MGTLKKKSSTLEGFEPYKFKLLPKVSFGYYGVFFNSGVIDGLSNPSYVQILLNAEEKKLAVRKCDKGDACAVPVKVSSDSGRWFLNNKDFIIALARMTGYTKDACYRSAVGKYCYEDNAYIFDLSEAELE